MKVSNDDGDHKIDLTSYKHIIIEKGGNRVVVQIGNTVIDIMHGYNQNKVLPSAIIEVYPYDTKQEYRLLIINDGSLIHSQ